MLIVSVAQRQNKLVSLFLYQRFLPIRNHSGELQQWSYKFNANIKTQWQAPLRTTTISWSRNPFLSWVEMPLDLSSWQFVCDLPTSKASETVFKFRLGSGEVCSFVAALCARSGVKQIGDRWRFQWQQIITADSSMQTITDINIFMKLKVTFVIKTKISQQSTTIPNNWSNTAPKLVETSVAYITSFHIVK